MPIGMLDMTEEQLTNYCISKLASHIETGELLIDKTNIPMESVLIEGMDCAIFGIDRNTNRVIYSYDECIEILIRQVGLPSYEKAVEYFNEHININHGEKTPIFMETL